MEAATDGADSRADAPGARTGGAPGWRGAIAFFVLASGAFILSRTRADPDLWGHVLFGRLMRGLGEIPRTDPYSYLATDWINHEWMAELIFGWAFDVGGAAGLVALKLILGMAIFASVYWLLIRHGLDEIRAGFVSMLALLLLSFGTSPVRPQLFTYLLFLVVLGVVRKAHCGRPAWLWILPPVFALWVNLHGGFLAGLGVLLLWSAGRLAVQWSRDGSLRSGLRASAPAWGATLGSAAATLINPYGFELLRFVLRTATVPRPEITEWNPVALDSVEGVFYLVFIIAVTWGVLGTRRHRRPELLVILGVTALLPLLAIRHVPLFALAGVVLGGPHLASTFRRRSSATAGSPRLNRWMAPILVLGGLLALGASVPSFRCIRVGEPHTEPFPQSSVALLRTAGVEGNMATFFNWGEYLIWHLGPRIQVSMDGRRETVYPDSIYREYFRFLHGVGDWNALLEERPTDLALVPRSYPVFNLLRLQPGWALAHSDSMSGLFARAGSRRLRALEDVSPEVTVSPAVTGSCFP